MTAAVFAVSSRGASTSARRGITVLAVLAVATELISLAWGLLPVDALQTFANATAWQGRLFDVVALCVGVGIAWPWLAPQVDRLTAAGARARDRWVDSTP
ncbi:hypothetical protein GCM10025867_17610 [Frondihabitans sucicola]|uniref:DUF2809 domain-containing protein n=1 Tax=Frondihabitans sucicola TaxID=1268041 RepID=A0ABM8GMT4_9MICO|nr:hypothetical protein [Frondihabitans sucicola]BDZ49520.1 hypothetical protein GCM10025867_17610 [Frondihabitans sucicola]